MARDHASARYRASAGDWTATLSGGSVIWWSDALSDRRHVALARSRGLHGLAVWSLGFPDRLSAP